jgi:ABC-2 type transport system ATP-binding protein
MITITHLTKTYPDKTQALRALDLTIGTGLFGLIGPNGSGKTTLMRILAGLLRPTSGTVVVLGNDMTKLSGRLNTKTVLGYLPQELGLYPDLTAIEFLEYIGRLKGVFFSTNHAVQLHDVLELVGLTRDAKRVIRTFSGGMKRRLGLAQALLGKPKLLIVDEPTVGLDPEERVRVRNLISGMAANCTIILSTHIIEDIGQSCNKLAVIKTGKVLFSGNPAILIEQARGHVWNLLADDKDLDPNLSLISTLPVEMGLQYRVVGNPVERYQATSVTPTLEDGYVWLMQQAHREAGIDEIPRHQG